MRKRKKLRRLAACSFLCLFVLMAASLYLFHKADTKTLWDVLPGIQSSAKVQDFCENLIMVGEHIPEDGQAANFATAITMMGSVAMAAETAQSESIHDQILSQYTVALYRSQLLKREGKVSPLEYELYKIPFKTGQTALMQRVLPNLQKRIGLPEGFMSQEAIESPLQEQQEEEQKLQQYKEEHLYGRYYQYGNFNSYLEISQSVDETYDMITFVLQSAEDVLEIQQEFRYKEDSNKFQTQYSAYGRSEFELVEDDVIQVTKGGVETPATYIRLNSSDFIIFDSSTRKLSAQEAAALDEHNRWLAKNEIYARHGYPFQNEELNQYFSGKRWYQRGEYAAEDFQESSLSEIERYNVDLLN